MNFFKIIAFTIAILFSQLSNSNSNFDTNVSEIFIPKVDVNGMPAFKNLSIKFNFENNTFKILGVEEYSTTLFDNIIFEIVNREINIRVGTKGCDKVETTVICHVLITNLEADRRIVVAGSGSGYGVSPSGGIDDLGNEYIPKVETSGKIDNAGNQKTLLKDVPVLYKFLFSNVSDVATKFTALKIALENPFESTVFFTLRSINF